MVSTVGYPEAEIQAAFDRYREAAADAGRTGNWDRFVDCFTEDVRYVEHHYGTFHGVSRAGQGRGVSNLYPSPRTVVMRAGFAGSSSILARSRLMCTSRVLVSPT